MASESRKCRQPSQELELQLPHRWGHEHLSVCLFLLTHLLVHGPAMAPQNLAWALESGVLPA